MRPSAPGSAGGFHTPAPSKCPTIQLRRPMTMSVAWIVFPLTLMVVVLLKWNPVVSLLSATLLGAALHGWL